MVYGLVEVSSRRGALSSSQIIYPSRDVVIKIDQEKLDKLDEMNIDITNMDSHESFKLEKMLKMMVHLPMIVRTRPGLQKMFQHWPNCVLFLCFIIVPNSFLNT